MVSPLNRHSAPQILRFFDLCFKQGVIDAYNFGDDYGAKEFVEKHKAAWDFGVLGEPDDYDWEYWRFTLYRWGRVNGFKGFAENYIYRISTKNYLWHFLPHCMRFYLLGIEEWLEYPQPTMLEAFKQEPKVHWKPVPANQRKMDVMDFVSYMHEWAHEYKRVPEEERQFAASTFDEYAKAIHTLNKKYNAAKKKFKFETDG